MMSSRLVNDLMTSEQKMVDAQTQISSGKQINKPSDNPLGTAQSMDLQSSISQIDQMSTNAGIVNSQLAMTDSTLSSVSSALTTVQNLAMQAGNSTLSDEGRQGIAAQLDQVMTQLVNTGNTQYNGNYLFAGNKTKTAPIASSGGATPTYSYVGDSGSYSVNIGPGISVTGNITGDKIFNMNGSANPSDPDVFTMISTLKQQVLSGDTTGISNSLTAINDSQTNVTALRAQVGARMDRITSTTTQLTNTKTNLKSLLSNTEDADMTQAMTDLQTQQTTYQAAISAAQKVFAACLVNYMQ